MKSYRFYIGEMPKDKIGMFIERLGQYAICALDSNYPHKIVDGHLYAGSTIEQIVEGFNVRYEEVTGHDFLNEYRRL